MALLWSISLQPVPPEPPLLLLLLLLLPRRLRVLQGRCTAFCAGWKEPREADESLTDMEGCELAGVFLNSSDHLRGDEEGWRVEGC